ncbi:MAG: hypothetical protein EKK46_11070 [Rhodocyclaceae bacterium]|nr:MAG: hypothetical protein EKK46_11070 [Rhodocyclaceae bacterium]
MKFYFIAVVSLIVTIAAYVLGLDQVAIVGVVVVIGTLLLYAGHTIKAGDGLIKSRQLTKDEERRLSATNSYEVDNIWHGDD